jgi:hypothetical protein
MSALLGFGLATFFRTVCKGKNCMIVEAPPLDQIENKIYKFNGKCYTYTPTTTKCNNKKETINS